MLTIDEKARKAVGKKASLGPDIDLQAYSDDVGDHLYVDELAELGEADRRQMIHAGVDAAERERSGTYIQKDHSVIHCKVKQEGLEVLSVFDALKKHNWLNDYFWKAVSVDTDKYTAQAHLKLNNGYFIRSLPGAKSIVPIQACLYLEKDNLAQNVHNIIIAEEDSELHIITGCATSPHLHSGLHVGISEFFIKKGAKLSFSMIHNWAENMMVRPRSVSIVGEGGLFLSNYICMKPVKSLQMYPTTHLSGKGAVARYSSILVGAPGSSMDVGSRVFLHAPETRAEIIARTISNGGTIVARGDLIGEVPGVKAHLECRGLILNGGIIHAIPELVGTVDGVDMSHEAAVGKIAQDEILYLMSRGLDEDEATATIVRGFLSVEIVGLPEELKAEIDRVVSESEKDIL